MPFETVDDLSTFFEVDGGPAVRVLITGPATIPANLQFAKTIAGIFAESSEAVGIYDDTEVEAANPSFECRSVDIDGVKREMEVRFLGLLPGEDGYGKTYQVARWAKAGDGTSRVYLKEL